MCGIIGYIGKEEALPKIINGLKAMEYRGYDSSGVALLPKGQKVWSCKAVGVLTNLENKIGTLAPMAQVGIGHSRWATHGKVTEANAHPHTDCTGKIWLVHNGIIENYEQLKIELVNTGHIFSSETDTEVIAHLIESFMKNGLSFEEAVRHALLRLVGTYGLVIAHSDSPGMLVAARQFSPLLIAQGSSGYFAASDQLAVAGFASHITYLDNGEFAVILADSYQIYNLANEKKLRTAVAIEDGITTSSKGGFEHFLLKEISLQPQSLADSLRGRIDSVHGRVVLGGLTEVESVLRHAKRLIFVGCGTAYHAGLLASIVCEDLLKIPSRAEVASEFRYRNPVFKQGDVVIVVSQSGETADTLGAVLLAKQAQMPVLGLVNVVGSSIAREVDAGVYVHAGSEVSVASTKAFTSQVALLILILIHIGQLQRCLQSNTVRKILAGMTRLPAVIADVIAQQAIIKEVATRFSSYQRFLFIGRKYSMPVALEGALKLTELAYVPALGYGAGEMKHGPLALVDRFTPTVVIAPKDSIYEKTVSNAVELKARESPLLAVVNPGSSLLDIAEYGIVVPPVHEILTPLVSSIPLQFLAYYIALERGYSIDQPRNLAKSVTVE
jgi:glucosamine--fructose-6-phosphate aminotransferase (isomerizing)